MWEGWAAEEHPLVQDMSLPTTSVTTFPRELRRRQTVEMEARRDQKMGWLWGCRLCSVSGGRTALGKELAEYSELSRGGCGSLECVDKSESEPDCSTRVIRKSWKV